MNLPNKLSLLRVACIPAIVALMYCEPAWCRYTALFLFVLACVTDFLDGYIARKYKLITDFGKFIDPLADKLLVLSAMIMLCDKQLLPGWLVIIILTRELAVDGLRLVAMTKNHVIAAGPLGKIKTFSQMIYLTLMFVIWQNTFSVWYLTVFALWIAAITLFSGIDYFVRNRTVFSA